MNINYVDLIIILVLMFGAWKGYQRGALNTLTGMTGYLAGLLVAGYYAQPVTGMLERLGLISQVAAKLGKAVPVPAPVAKMPAWSLGTRETGKLVDGLSLPGFLRERLQEQLGNINPAPGGGTVGDMVSYALAGILVRTLVALALIIIAVLLVRFVSGLITRGIGHTVLGSLNRIAGFTFGAALYGIILALLVGILSPVLLLKGGSPTGWTASLGISMDQSQLVPFLINIYGWIGSKLVHLV